MAQHMKSISIPSDKEDEIRKYISLLSVKEEEDIDMEEIEIIENEDDDAEYEVKNVISHSLMPNGEYKFKIVFSDGTTEWIEDSATNCEQSIMKYKKIPTVYVFCRVSTKSQVGEGHISLDAQESEVLKVVKEKYPGFRIKVNKISSSAYKKIPTCLAQIGEAAISGSHILVYRIDRLSRNIVNYLPWMEDLDKRGVGIHSVDNKISYNTHKVEFIQCVLNAQKESDLIGSRVKMSIQKRKERGDECIGGLPYGKKFRRTEIGKLEIVDNEEDIKTIEYIKSATINSDELASILNKNGRVKKGRKWTSKMILNIKKTK